MPRKKLLIPLLNKKVESSSAVLTAVGSFAILLFRVFSTADWEFIYLITSFQLALSLENVLRTARRLKN